MAFIPSFEIGQVVTNPDIVSEFRCGNMGGMRRSRETNTLVIVSDHTKGLYEDKWIGDVLHYTGMGKNGHQDINFAQNRTLAESRTNGISVHLFEVLIPGKYVYMGQIELCDDPYQERQKGEDGLVRSVWMFPVRMRSDTIVIDEETIQEYEINKQRIAQRLSTTELKKRAQDGQNDKVSVRNVSSAAYIRDPYVSEYAKRRANGHCQLCDQKAPFLDRNNKPYLETHHIVWLSQGGPDSIDNTVALCPNCHSKMHILNLKSDIVFLKSLVIVSTEFF